MIDHNITVVLAGASAHFLTGWVLNCDMLLGKLWKKEKKSKYSGLSKDIRVNLAAQFLVSIALTVATCVAITICKKTQGPTIGEDVLERLTDLFFNQENTMKSMANSIRIVLFIWAGFIVPSSIGEVIWCGHDFKAWAIEMVCDFLGLAAIAATVTYLA